MSCLVCIEWKPVVRLDIQSSTCIALDWSQAAVDRFQIQQQVIERSFKEDSGAGAGITWTRS